MSIQNQLILGAQHRFVASASPAEWARIALELQYSAKALWAQEHLSTAFSNSFDTELNGRSMVSRSALLLYGLALENLLKAIAVANNPAFVAAGELNGIKSHDLLRLASIAGVPLDSDETAICETASEAIPYWGRYPIPLTMSALRNEQVLGQQMLENLDRLFDRLTDELTIKLSGVWDSGNGIRIVQFERRGNRFTVQYEIDMTPGTTSGPARFLYEFGSPEQ